MSGESGHGGGESGGWNESRSGSRRDTGRKESVRESDGESGAGGGESGSGGNESVSRPTRSPRKPRVQRLSSGSLDRLHTNQRLLVIELLRRGATVEVVDLGREHLLVRYDGKQEHLFDRTNWRVPDRLVQETADKSRTKQALLAAGISVTPGRLFRDEAEMADALAYADELGYPVVVKPNWGSHGDDVYTDIADRVELYGVLTDVVREHGAALVERQAVGSEFRVFCTVRGDFAILRREPASVVGDGRSDISELVNHVNGLRQRRGSKLLCPLVIDDAAIRYLVRHGRVLGSVPKPGERVFLRGSSNIAKGGVGIDVTELAHPSVIHLARRVLQQVFHGLPCIGLDLMTEDISRPIAPASYRVIEVNSNPGLSMHMMPAEGQPRDVASYLADVIFPDLPKRQ